MAILSPFHPKVRAHIFIYKHNQCTKSDNGALIYTNDH